MRWSWPCPSISSVLLQNVRVDDGAIFCGGVLCVLLIRERTKGVFFCVGSGIAAGDQEMNWLPLLEIFSWVLCVQALRSIRASPVFEERARARSMSNSKWAGMV